MSCLGVHFALTEDEATHLRSLTNEQVRLEHLQAVIEEHYFKHEKEFTAESDKAWDAMHSKLEGFQLHAKFDPVGAKNALDIRSQYGVPRKELTDWRKYVDESFYDRAT